MIHAGRSSKIALFRVVLTALASLGAVSIPLFASPIYQDQFTDGNLNTAEGPMGIAWTVPLGSATVTTVSGDKRMAIPQGDNIAVTNFNVTDPDFTLMFNGYVTWSEKARVVLLYKDNNNYYSVGIGGQPGIFRMMNGQETLVQPDTYGYLRLPHASGSPGTFKFYVKVTASSIEIKGDRNGDGVDYDLKYVDADPAAVAKFRSGAVGFMTDSAPSTSKNFTIDNVVIDDSLVEDPRIPAIYYVSGASGDDARSITEAQSPSTPWKTIQKAADLAQSGDTVRIMPGIYNETLSPKYSGSETKPLTFEAADMNNKPVLEGSNSIDVTSWQSVSITDFRGQSHSVYRAQLPWTTNAIFQGETRLFAAQEPNQSDPDDPFNHSEMMILPNAENPGTLKDEMVDSVFLTQPVPNYWVGATALLYDGFSNTVVEAKVTEYLPGLRKLITTPFGWTVGPDRGKQDRYALRDHIGLIDKPGEYFIDTTVLPNLIYVWPYDGQNINTVKATRYLNGVSFPGHKAYIVINGLEVRSYMGSGIVIGSSEHITVKNCVVHHNMGSGVSGNGSYNSVLKSYLHSNHETGVSFGRSNNILISGCEITRNDNNGIWFGTGGGTNLFAAEYITIRNNYIHHQGGGYSHPDNYQMHMVRHILMEGNLFVQDGHQNMWTQYSDDFIIRNNIFIGGTVGINSTINSKLYHNIFYNGMIRYDAHLVDHPVYPDYYKPQSVVMKNNIMVKASLVGAPEDVVPKSVYQIDHNMIFLDGAFFRNGYLGKMKSPTDNSFQKQADFVNVVVKLPDENGDFDFHLVQSTMCVDAGVTVAVGADFEGHKRPFGSAPDIGPYEYGSTEVVEINDDPFDHSTSSTPKPPTPPGSTGQAESSILPFKKVLLPLRGQGLDLKINATSAGHVKMVVYDRTGTEVVVLKDEDVSAGEHPVRWDGRDKGGSMVASGTYLIKANINNRTETHKIVLVK